MPPKFLEFIVRVYKVVQNIANGRIRKFNVACNYGSETAGGILMKLNTLVNPFSAKQSFQLWYPGGQRLKVISFS